VSARQLDLLGAVDVGKQAQTEPLRVRRIGEAVYGQRRLRGVEGFSHALVLLVVGNRAPEGRFAVRDRLRIWRDRDDINSAARFALPLAVSVA